MTEQDAKQKGRGKGSGKPGRTDGDNREGFAIQATKSVSEGDVPNTIRNQNLGHNAKKEGLGRNTNL